MSQNLFFAAFTALALLPIACSAAAPTPEPATPARASEPRASASGPVSGARDSEPRASASGPVSGARDSEPRASASGPAPSADALPEIPKGTAVLLIGDSFALAGFAQALKPRMMALGVRYEVRTETSSFTTTWSSKMDRLVANMQPDLVLINLGANEVANTDPAAHAPAIRHIVSAINGRPCVWISPPSWRKDTGIIDVIRQNSAPCRFFDSDKLVQKPIPRQKDRIHPNDEGGAIWADAFWSWLQGERAPTGAAAQGKAKASPWMLKPPPPEEHVSVAGPGAASRVGSAEAGVVEPSAMR